jgi:hypothetical protein
MEVTITINQSVGDSLDALIEGGSLVGKIGWTASDIHEDPISGRSEQVATTALKNEFGFITHWKGKDVHVPARPMFRNTIRRESDNWLNTIAVGAAFVLNNQISFEAVLDSVTKEAVQDVRDTVQQRLAPPLSPVTLQLRLTRSIIRKSGKLSSGTLPLYDTGHMMQTLTNEVIPE